MKRFADEVSLDELADAPAKVRASERILQRLRGTDGWLSTGELIDATAVEFGLAPRTIARLLDDLSFRGRTPDPGKPLQRWGNARGRKDTRRVRWYRP